MTKHLYVHRSFQHICSSSSVIFKRNKEQVQQTATFPKICNPLWYQKVKAKDWLPLLSTWSFVLSLRGMKCTSHALRESRHWSPDHSYQWHNGPCLCAVFYNCVETGVGTFSFLAWCPPPAAWGEPRQVKGERVSLWGVVEEAVNRSFGGISSVGCWSWVWSHRWEESARTWGKDKVFFLSHRAHKHV